MATPGGGAGQPVLAALTGLRAIAAGWVVIFHFRQDLRELLPMSRFASPAVDSGSAGVDVFFILSGFIICFAYFDRLSEPLSRQTGQFLWLRLARIYPLHFFTLLAFAVLAGVAPAREVGFGATGSALASGEFYRQLFLLHAWGLVREGDVAWNYPAWSISSEWFAYLTFPLLLLLLRRAASARAALLGLGVSLALNAAAYGLIDALGFRGDIALNRVAFEFSAGCFLYLLWRERWAFGANWTVLTPTLTGVALLITVGASLEGAFAGIVAAPFYAGVIYALAVRGGALGRILGSRLAVYAGEASYALYMTHALVERFVGAYLPSTDFGQSSAAVRLGILGTYALLAVLTAVVAYECLEKPARQTMRRWAPGGASTGHEARFAGRRSAPRPGSGPSVKAKE
jgi:peptidoglycan/LPS O-acetylase OafA/YrhL